MITIELLANHPEHVPTLSQIWYETIGKHYRPDVTLEQAEERFKSRLNRDTLPLTLVALKKNKPIGMASLRNNDGIRPDLTPWLGSLCVDPISQGHGVGRALIDAVKKKAKEMGYPKLYLFTFDALIPKWYEKLGWTSIGQDEFEGKPTNVMEISL